MRTDIHRPSAINPDEYEYVAQECLKVEGLGDCEILLEMRRRIQEHMARTGGHYATHQHGGNCMVCGNVLATYTILFWHRPTNTYVRMGSECADKCAMGGNFNTSAFRAAVHDALQAKAGKKKAQAMLAKLGLEECWKIWENPPQGKPIGQHYAGCDPSGYYALPYEESTIIDIVGKLVKFGSISDAQINFLRKLLTQISTRAEREAKRKAEHDKAADCPTGRLEIRGEVLTIKVQENQFGYVTKMLVRADSGYKVWGTRPSGLNVERGAIVAFTATVEPSPDDPKFGFFSRPTKAREITTLSMALVPYKEIA